MIRHEEDIPRHLRIGKQKTRRVVNKNETLIAIEKQKKLPYKKLRNKFYNSRACDKYNMQDIAGLACIDTKNPMKDKASLELVFEEA